MLSYKEYKLLNESLYGAFNLGLRSHGTVGGIVSGSSVNGTEAALEAQAEEAIEEGKKAKKMKKKMDGDEEEEEVKDEEPIEKIKSSKEDDEDEEDSEEEDHEEDSEDDDDEDEEDSEEEDHEEDSEENSEKKDFAFMKKKSKSKMKKKAKKEWSSVMSDLENILENIDDEEALLEVKKGLEMMKKGMEKGMKKGCGCKKCGKMMNKNMNEDEAAWWKSVNGMLGADPDQKNWDGGWKEVGEVQQAVRENAEVNEVSSDLLRTAADVAGSRTDPRGLRLKGKFGAAADRRAGEEFDNAEKIVVKRLTDHYEMDVMIRRVEIVDNNTVADVHVFARRAINMSDMSHWANYDSAEMPKSMILSIEKRDGKTPVLSANPHKNIVVSLDGVAVDQINRRGAVMLAKAVNDAAGFEFIRPTDLPLE